MAKIHEITKFGGLAQVLGRAREFIFEHDALTIEGVSFEEVQLMLGLLETTSHLGSAQLAYSPPAPISLAPISLEEIQRALGPAPAPAQSPPLPPRAPAAPKPVAAAPAAAAVEPAEKRGPGRPRKPRPEDNAKPGALDAILGRAAAAGQAIASASVPTKPAVEPTPEPKPAPAPAPKKEEPVAPPVPDEDEDEDDDEDLADSEDEDEDESDDDEPVDDVAEEPAPAPVQVAAKPVPAPAPAPKPGPKPNGTAAPKVEMSAAERRAEAKEKTSARTLVDDAEEEAAPRPAASAAAANRTAPAAVVKPVPNGASYLLDPANLPKEVYEAKTMRALISYFVKNGVRTVDKITAECERIRSQSNMLKSVTDLRSRVEAALELLPAQATA